MNRVAHRKVASWSSLKSSEGQSLVETALLLPVLLLLLLNTMNFATYIYGWITVTHSARAALEYQVYNGVTIGFPGAPSFSQVCGVWSQETSSLPNIGTWDSTNCRWTNATLKICSKTGTSSAVCSGTGSFTTPSDPGNYTLYSVDVAYTYTPVAAAFSIPALGISLSMPTTIERSLVMRSMN